MNLTALRQKIKNLTDYSPELQQFNDQLDELLNDAFYSLWSLKRWSFATKVVPFDFHIDITSTTDTEYSGGSAIALTATQDERRVTLSANIGRLSKVDVWEGCPISIEGQEYTISRIDSLSSIILTESYKSPTTTTTEYTIKKRFYDLPEDCLELLYLGHRDYPYNTVSGSFPPYGKTTAILPRREEVFGLRADYASTYAEAYIPSPAQFIEPAEKIELTEFGSGNISAGYYELCWAFVKDGKIGSLSQPETIQVADNAVITVKFYGFDDITIQADSYQSNDQIAPQWEGYRKVLFWNKNLDRSTGERTGLPCWLSVVNGGTTRNSTAYLQPVTVADTAGSVTITNINQFDNGSPRYIEIDGQHQQIRPYPRVNGFDEKIVKTNDETIYLKQAIIRYMRKPKDMLLPTDSPDMPYEFHQLIVYKALEDIYLKLGQQSLANTYEKKYTKELKQLERRYVDKIDLNVRRGQFGMGGMTRGYDASMLKWNG